MLPAGGGALRSHALGGCHVQPRRAAPARATTQRCPCAGDGAPGAVVAAPQGGGAGPCGQGHRACRLARAPAHALGVSAVAAALLRRCAGPALNQNLSCTLLRRTLSCTRSWSLSFTDSVLKQPSLPSCTDSVLKQPSFPSNALSCTVSCKTKCALSRLSCTGSVAKAAQLGADLAGTKAVRAHLEGRRPPVHATRAAHLADPLSVYYSLPCRPW